MPDIRRPRNLESLDVHVRLIGWGQWVIGGMPKDSLARSDMKDLGEWDLDDVLLLEWVLTTWARASTRGSKAVFTLKVHYADVWSVERQMHDKVSRRTYYRWLKRARLGLDEILPAVGTKNILTGALRNPKLAQSV